MAQADTIKQSLAKKDPGAGAPAPDQPEKRTIASELERLKPQLMKAIPSHMDADRLTRIALTTIRQNPKIAECTPSSLLGAVMQAAQVGLEPDALGSCYLVPYNRKVKDPNGEYWVKEVQFQIGYKGMLELVRRTGEVLKIAAHEVYENDVFEVEYGTEEKLRHVPEIIGDRGKLIAFYAHAKFRNGSDAFTVMGLQDINHVRDKFSKAKDYGPWVDHYESMAKKTVIKALIKYMPISVEVQKSIAQDETVKSSIDSDPIIIDMPMETE